MGDASCYKDSATTWLLNYFCGISNSLQVKWGMLHATKIPPLRGSINITPLDQNWKWILVIHVYLYNARCLFLNSSRPIKKYSRVKSIIATNSGRMAEISIFITKVLFMAEMAWVGVINP
jgi:hypothetical protein